MIKPDTVPWDGSGRQWAPGWIRCNKEWITVTTDTLTTLKLITKRFARVQRLRHMAALDIVAQHLKQAHWRGLVEQTKQGWSPTPQQLTELEAALAHHRPTATDADAVTLELGDALVFTSWNPANVPPMEADEIHGELDGHPFYLVGDFFSVAFGSQGWETIFDQSPVAAPVVRKLGGRVTSAPALDPAFVARAKRLAKIRAERMYAAAAIAWPRRSIVPDSKGRTQHPLGNGLAAEWHCLHCDGVHDGATMAEALWHCPDCGATPVDIFAEPFWSPAEQLA
jgi:hypothetical protein